MPSVNLEPPYTIASLQKPLDGTHGRTLAATVYGLQDSRKRKRHEFVVGVDGESVDIYNVRNHSLITSYALPPQSYLCAAPCSALCRSSTSSESYRKTFVLIKDGYHDKKKRLLCFTEKLNRKNSVSSESPTVTKQERRLLDDVDVLALETVAPNTSLEIVLFLADGGVITFSDGLSSEKRYSSHSSKSSEIRVEYASVLDAEGVRKGLLQNRHDVLAVLESDGVGSRIAEDNLLLAQVVHLGDVRLFQLLALRLATNKILRPYEQGLKLLLEHQLLPTNRQREVGTKFDFHAESGLLHHHAQPKLRTYDLTGVVPRTVIQIGTRSEPVDSFAQLSATSLLLISGHTATVFETFYGSKQASVSLENAGYQPPREKNPTSTTEEALPDTLRAMSAFSKIGLIVGLHGNKLLGLHLKQTSATGNAGALRNTRLADVIGKGSLRDAYNFEKDSKKARSWQLWVERVDQLIRSNSISELESLAMSGDEFKLSKMNTQITNKQPVIAPHIKSSLHSAPGSLRREIRFSHFDRKKALHIMGKMFSPAAQDVGHLRINLKSEKFLKWLALTGLLTTSNLEKVMGTAVKRGALFTVIGQLDQGYEILLDLIRLPVHWDIEEVVQAAIMFIKSPECSLGEEPALALLESQHPSSIDRALDKDIGVLINKPLNMAEQGFESALEVFPGRLGEQREMVQDICTRLNAFPTISLTKALRSMMSHSDLVSFIQVLRIELADCGWTSHYVNHSEEFQSEIVDGIAGSEDQLPRHLAIRIISNLLNCAADAIGMRGWLVGLSSDVTGTSLWLESLRAEVSAGLEGCYEACTIATSLTEIERVAARVAAQSTSRSGRSKTWDVALASPGEGNEPLPLDDGFVPLATSAIGRNGSRRKRRTSSTMKRERKIAKYSLDRIDI